MKHTKFFGLVPILGVLMVLGHVAGSFASSHFWSTTGNAGTDPTTNFLGTADEQSLVIRTNAEERMRVTARGRVGVGTANPDAKLHVMNFGSQGPFLHIEEASGLIGFPHFLFLSSDGQLGLGTNQPAARLHVRAGDGEDSLVVRHFGNDNPELLIDSDSNVGINTSDPSARLVIRNDSLGQRPLLSVIAGDQTPFHMSSAGSVTIDPVGAGVALRVRASSSFQNSTTTPVPFYVSAADDVNAIYVTRDGDVGIGAAGEGINDQLRIRGEENNGSRASVRIISGASQQTMLLDGNEIDAVNAGLFLNHNSDENVVLTTGGGNVGVGVSNPNNKLSVRNNNHQLAIIDSDNNDKTWTLTSHQNTGGVGLWENGTQGRFVVTAGGRIGIGTTNPNHELVVQGNDPAFQIQDDTTDNSPNAARFELLERAGGNFDGGAFFWWNGETNKLLIGTKASGDNTTVLVVDRASSSVGIGTQNPGNFRLAVNGRIRAKEIVVETGWSDFVFEPNYPLPSLEQVEAHIRAHRHLPGIPSAPEVAEHGIKVGEMESKLLGKIEELTLYLIDIHKRVSELEQENARLRGGLDLVAAKQAGAGQ